MACVSSASFYSTWRSAAELLVICVHNVRISVAGFIMLRQVMMAEDTLVGGGEYCPGEYGYGPMLERIGVIFGIVNMVGYCPSSVLDVRWVYAMGRCYLGRESEWWGRACSSRRSL